MNNTVGKLFVVATPIGHLDDISRRALDTLRSATLILAEDTRTFRTLALRYGITTPLQSYHEHNEAKKAPDIVEKLLKGAHVALVSDAGTPTISDPGYRLVKLCHEHSVPVLSVPGPCAAIAALSISGLPSDRFYFEGFLSVKKGKKRRALKEALERGVTTLIYESPHRILNTMGIIEELDPKRRVFLAREMTKLYEESFSGTVAEVKEALTRKSSIKGEIVLIVGNPLQRSTKRT